MARPLRHRRGRIRCDLFPDFFADHHMEDLFLAPLLAVAILNFVHPAESLFAVPDRKSTRLNSSHVEISYAVFCLKKKNLACRIHFSCRLRLPRSLIWYSSGE